MQMDAHLHNRDRILCQNCVTYTPKPRSNTEIYRLRGSTHRCCGKSLVGTALVRFHVRQHARTESISKRCSFAASMGSTSARGRTDQSITATSRFPLVLPSEP